MLRGAAAAVARWALSLLAAAAAVALLALRAALLLAGVAWGRLTGADGAAALPTAQSDTGDDVVAATAARRGSRGRVAVVGGGIAGCSAAWALARSGFEVELFERERALGGNAKTQSWPDGVVTGLSVLAWPPSLFVNYRTLLGALGVASTPVGVSFYVRDAGGRDFEQGDPGAELNKAHAADMARWERAVSFARHVNAWFCPQTPGRGASIYDMNMLNPLNVLPLRWLARGFGVSSAFWRDVVVPVYASTFLTVLLDDVPAVILPVVSDIIPLGRPAALESWVGDSREVFDRLTAGVTVRCGSPVTDVRRGGDRLWAVNGEHRGFHRVVFATNAPHVADACERGGGLPAGVGALLHGVAYATHRDRTFERGVVHTDADVVLPDDASGKLRARLLTSHANYVEARPGGDGGVPQMANTFILSSWYPRAVAQKRSLPRLVTYNVDAARKPRPALVVGHVDNAWNHPALSPGNLAALYLLRLAQGARGVYYCGSLATPGNGHDLSLCSGLAVARAIGAEYPFDDDPVCRSDLDKLARIMGL